MHSVDRSICTVMIYITSFHNASTASRAGASVDALLMGHEIAMTCLACHVVDLSTCSD